MKKTSCGVIVTDRKGDWLLAVVPWGRKDALDIPKGELEPGEYPATCAIRELYEETGLVVRASQLEDLGEFSYTAEKKLHLFLLRAAMPDTDSLACVSMMNNPFTSNRAVVPEVVGYEITTFDDPRFYKSLQPVLSRIQDII